MPKGIYKRIKKWKLSKETKERMSFVAKQKGFGKWMKGRTLSKETKRKIGLNGFHYGMLWKKASEETKKKMSQSQMGRKPTIGMTGKKLSEETKLKMSLMKKGKPTPWTTGERSHLWKGGITPINQKIRMSSEYKDWRIKIFERDNYTCQFCGSRGVELCADHIKPFAYFPELRLVIDNGRTLCKPCHKKTDSYAGKAQKNYKLNEMNY